MADADISGLKACTKCGETKDLQHYHRVKHTPDGRRAQCRDCYNHVRRARYDPERSAALQRAARQKHRERYREYDQRAYAKNKGAGSDYQKRRYARRDKELAAEELRRWRLQNADKVRAASAARAARDKERRKTDPAFREAQNKKSRDWAARKRQEDAEFRQKHNAAVRAWHAANRERQNAYKRKLNQRRRKDDLPFRIKSALRSRLRRALLGKQSTGAAIKHLGCTLDAFRTHIEAQFLPGMTWDNWGRGWRGVRQWHIDHIRPLAAFDLTDPEQIAAACHYTNLRPLWAVDNLSKGARECPTPK